MLSVGFCCVLTEFCDFTLGLHFGLQCILFVHGFDPEACWVFVCAFCWIDCWDLSVNEFVFNCITI